MNDRPLRATVCGHACGVSEYGSLLLATAQGVERFTLGEISLRPDKRGTPRDK